MFNKPNDRSFQDRKRDVNQTEELKLQLQVTKWNK